MTSSDGDRARDIDPRAAAPRGRGLRNWRVRSRLIALIAVPTVVALALGAVGVGGAVSAAAAYGRVGTLADVAAALTTSVGDLQSEQSESAAYVGAGRTADRSRAVADAQRRTDEGTGRLRALAAGVGDAYPDSTRDRLRRVLFRLDTLPALRTAVTEGRLPAGVTVDRYDTVVTDLLGLDDEIAQEGTDPELSSSVRALGALSRSRAALATQRALLESALLAGRFEPGGADAFAQAIADQSSALQQFRTTASVSQSQAYDDVVAGADVDQTSAIRDGITAGRPPTGGAAAAGGWESSVTGTLGKVGQAESGLVTAVADRADQLRSDQVRQAWIIGIIALAVILIVLLATIAVARSLVRPLRALRDGALSVAERRLPDTVARLDREDPDTVDTRVEPIAVHSADEIGEVARSFDAVHQEAVRAAAGEARRRAQAGALFVTLSRRTQSLVDRQIELIDDLERGEEDADRLDSLFRLDHLATRMRRNGENLLVLGGQEPVRRWNRRLGLLEVLRAALSEIEQYPRVDVGEVPDVTLAESAVSDVVHLLAELLDNATAFSSRQSRVDVSATALPDGSALVEITDRGIGLTAQECEELGKRLAAPTEVGVDASRRMGLYVVGRLAARLGAQVWLAPGSPRGVTASVTLPAAVLTEDASGPVPGTRPDPSGTTSGTTEGAWIGERFSKAIATPGPGADSWFGGASLASAAPVPGSPVTAAPESEVAGAAAFVPTASGTTEAGLPLRRPGANEVPGTGAPATSDQPDAPHGRAGAGRHAAREPEQAPADPRPDAEAADRSPDAIRERYARYQRGRRGAAGAAEAAGSTTAAPDPTSVTRSDAAPSSVPGPARAADPPSPTIGSRPEAVASAPGTAGPSPSGDVGPAPVAPGPPPPGGASPGSTSPGPTPSDGTGSTGTSSGTSTGEPARSDAASEPAPVVPASDAAPSGTAPSDPSPSTSEPTERSGGFGTAAGVGVAGAATAGAAWAASRGDTNPDETDGAGTAEDAGDRTDPAEVGRTPGSGQAEVGRTSENGQAEVGRTSENGQADAPPTTPMPAVSSGDRPAGSESPEPAAPTAPSGPADRPDTAPRQDAPSRPANPARPVMPGPHGVDARPGAPSGPAGPAQPDPSSQPGPPAPGGTPAGTAAAPGTAGTAPAGGVPAPDVPWGAGAVREPTAAGSTTSGLPLRAPGANYVPGSVPDEDGIGDTGGRDDTDGAGGAGGAGGANDTDDTDGTGSGPPDGNGAATQGGDRLAWDRSAEAIRRRFAAHQEGRRRGMERTGR